MSDPDHSNCAAPGCKRSFKHLGTGHRHCHAHSACSFPKSGTFIYKMSPCYHCIKLYHAGLAMNDASVTYIWRLNEWIRGVAKNWSRPKGQKAVRWDCMGDDKEREQFLTLLEWAKKSKTDIDNSLPCPSSSIVPAAALSSSSTSHPISLSPTVTVRPVSTVSPSKSIPSSSGVLQREEGGVSRASSPLVQFTGLDGSCAGGEDWEDPRTPPGMDRQLFREVLRPFAVSVDKRFEGMMSLMKSLIPTESSQRARDCGEAARPSGDLSGRDKRSPVPSAWGSDSGSTSGDDIVVAPQLRWHIITDQRIVGMDSLQFAGEPYVYGPEQIDLDLNSAPPRFRFKTGPRGDRTVVRPPKDYDIKLSVLKAFQQFGDYFVNAGVNVDQLLETFPSKIGGLWFLRTACSSLRGL